MPTVEDCLTNRDLLPSYLHKERDPRVALLGTAVLSTLFHPQVGFAEGVEQEMHEHSGEGGVYLMASFHTQLTDPLHDATLPRKRPAEFGRLEGRGRIGAKIPLFGIPAVRWFIEEMGAFPITREKDLVKYLGREPNQPEMALLRAHNQDVVDLSIDVLEGGDDVFIFPSATRTDEPSEIKSGVGRIATGVSSDVNLAILPIGIYYSRFRWLDKIAIKGQALQARNLLVPTLYVDHLMRGPFLDYKQVTLDVQSGIYAGVAGAKMAAPRRIYYRDPA